MKIYALYPLNFSNKRLFVLLLRLNKGIHSDHMKVCFSDSSHNTFSHKLINVCFFSPVIYQKMSLPKASRGYTSPPNTA